MSHNPWKNIPRPLGTEYYKTLAVDQELNPADLPVYWAVDYEGNRAIYFEYPRTTGNGRDISTPAFKSISMRDIDCGHRVRAFVVTLEAAGMEDIFFEMCCDLVHAVQEMPKATTRTALIHRLERWSSLFRGVRAGLSLAEQRGLFAELVFLKRYGIPTMGESNAVKGWIGPEKGRQDYRFGQTFIEVKSKRGAGANTVTISSEHQLYSSDEERLFLYVLEENEANGNGGSSLTELATRIKDSLSSPIARTEFMGKMLQAGFDFVTRYDTRWTLGKEFIYLVEGSFPRLINLSDGISHVTYSIDLSACVEYMSDATTMRYGMRGNNG